MSSTQSDCKKLFKTSKYISRYLLWLKEIKTRAEKQLSKKSVGKFM